MDNDHKKFINWLKTKHKVKTDDELKKILDDLGEDQIKEEYQSFKNKSYMENGGKLNYLKCLNLLKKGGKMGDCGCNKKIPKAFLGSILSAASTIGKVGKAANTLSKVGKVANTIGKVASVAKEISPLLKKGVPEQTTTSMIPMQPNLQVGLSNPTQIPNAVTSVNPLREGFAQRSVPKIPGYKKGSKLK